MPPHPPHLRSTPVLPPSSGLNPGPPASLANDAPCAFLRTEELLESPGFQQKLEGQQAETMRAMEACIDDVFKEIAEGLEVELYCM